MSLHRSLITVVNLEGIGVSENKIEKILIVDDSEMNRAMLTAILDKRYEILEAENGEAALVALKEHGVDISLVLLDIVMPKMDGFEVLAVMNETHIIEKIPVIMISAENGTSHIKRAYDLGVSDYISRPFDAEVVQKRVNNTLMLYAKQKRLVEMVTDQIYEKQKSNSILVNILSHVVEFRNGESGMHILHVNTLTHLLLKLICKKTDKYKLSEAEIDLISMASSLHDIGKIAIPDNILNKPGRLTKEEFEVMKTHSAIGYSLIEEVPYNKDEPLLKISSEICRWHHERYDGRGYPDGLKGDEIPIYAQVVSLADVYDALTSERVYKSAYSHEKAIEMILNGECGAFNPILLECLKESGDLIREELKVKSFREFDKGEIVRIADEMLKVDLANDDDSTVMLLHRGKDIV